MKFQVSIYIVMAALAYAAFCYDQFVIYPRTMRRKMQEMDAKRAERRAVRIRQAGSTFQANILRRVA